MEVVWAGPTMESALYPQFGENKRREGQALPHAGQREERE